MTIEKILLIRGRVRKLSSLRLRMRAKEKSRGSLNEAQKSKIQPN